MEDNGLDTDLIVVMKEEKKTVSDSEGSHDMEFRRKDVGIFRGG